MATTLKDKRMRRLLLRNKRINNLNSTLDIPDILVSGSHATYLLCTVGYSIIGIP